MSDSFAELFEQSQIENKMRPGTIISAKVLDIKNDNVIVNAGLKSEGIIPIEQFFDDQGQLEITIGDDIDVSLDTIECCCDKSIFNNVTYLIEIKYVH